MTTAEIQAQNKTISEQIHAEIAPILEEKQRLDLIFDGMIGVPTRKKESFFPDERIMPVFKVAADMPEESQSFRESIFTFNEFGRPFNRRIN